MNFKTKAYKDVQRRRVFFCLVPRMCSKIGCYHWLERLVLCELRPAEGQWNRPRSIIRFLKHIEDVDMFCNNCNRKQKN